jgi:hypothetical protein
MTYNFEIRNNKITLFTAYERETQKVLLIIESILQNAKQLRYAALRGT